MSLRNENQLMASMFNRATSVTFDPVIPMQRAQFNPATGSWVFGLAAFAAGVAINKMMHSETASSPEPPAPKDGGRREIPRAHDLPISAPSHSAAASYGGGSMRDLLHDTMAEESRSGEYLNTLAAQMAKLRAEVAALSAQKEQMKDGSYPHYTETVPAFEELRSASCPEPAGSQKPEFELVRETLDKLNAEKAKLVQTEQSLNRVLTEQQQNGANNDVLEAKIQQIQAELDALHSEQSKIQSQYQDTKREANDTQVAMEQLKLMLNEKIAKLHEAEASEASLRNDHKILIETVERLKGKLEIFRKQASQDQSGVTSLRILEQSNSRLVEQINASKLKAEQQQAALNKLAAEKSDLDNKLAHYQEVASVNQTRMEQLEGALKQAQNTEQKLLLEVERLSSNQASLAKNTDADGKVAQLEAELLSARNDISDLERNENELLQRLTAAEQSGSDELTSGGALFEKIKSERDELKNTLSLSEKRNSDVKTDLVIAAEKEEELSTQISSLLDKISSLENERDLYKSKADVDQLQVTNAKNEYQALKQSILTLESEKNSLSSELEEYQRVTKQAQKREAQATARVRESLEKEKNLTQDIERIKAGLVSNDDRQREYLAQQNALQQAEIEIRSLLDSRVQKDQELEAARREMAQLDSQLQSLTNQAGLLAQDEQNSSKQVSLIQDQLKHRDNAIAEARVKEEHLQREVEVLQQTSSSLHSEVNRLRAIQQEQGYGSSSASLDVLRDTEAQLIAQLEQSRNEIGQQHQNLIKSEQDKAQLEIQYREESIKLASLKRENESLHDQLAQWQSHEAAYSDKIAGLNSESEKYQQLQNEYQHILQKQDELVAQSENAHQLTAQLQHSLVERDAQLTQLINERDSLNKQLFEIREDLQQATAERNHLQQTCSQLQATIQELEAQHQQREGQHREALSEMEYKFQQKLAQSEKVIPLTANDAVKSEQPTQQPQEKSTTSFESLDTSMFDSAVSDTDAHSPVSENLFQSTKVGRLRKFQGHRKTTDLEEKERELDQPQAQKTDQEVAKKAKEEISQEEADDDLEKTKAYSPNRSFVDLLEDNERLRKEQKPVDLETQWSELDELPEEELLEDSGNLKPLLIGGLAAGVAVGCAAYFLFTGKQSEPDNVAGVNQSQSKVETATGNSSSSQPANTDSAEKIEKLEEEILSVLQEFSLANDFASKAKLTRLPNLSLRDMKIYAASNSQDFKVESVEYKATETHVDIKFIKAVAKVRQDGKVSKKAVYLTENEQGELLIDWHTYVKYEVAPWHNFLDLDQNEKSQNWSVIAERTPNQYDKFPSDKYESLTVRSSNPDSFGKAVAYLSKSDPMYQQLIDVYNKDGGLRKKFILRLSHVGDGSRTLIVDEVISLSEFYLNDIAPTVSSSYGDIYYGDSSY